MKKIFYFIFAALLVATGCKKLEIETYDRSENYIHFQKSVEDSVSLSFLAYPNLNSVEYSIPLELVGLALPSDKKYKVSVDKSLSTAVEGTHFRFVNDGTFKAGLYVDTCRLQFLRTPDMKTKDLRLVLRIDDNENFKAGQYDRSFMIFHVSDMIFQPAWWSNYVIWYYLGNYSDKKFKLFIEVTGQIELNTDDESQVRYYSLKLKHYLESEAAQGRTVYEDNGEEMTCEVIG